MNKEDAKRRLKVIELESQRLQEMIEAPEKPKRRHGDFGFDQGLPRLDLKALNDSMFTAGKNCCGSVGSDVDNPPDPILGNVFDLMKGWGKPFEEYDADKYATGIMIREAKIRIYACEGTDCKKEDCSCGLFLKEAEDFYNALGHAIAELKQKQGN